MKLESITDLVAARYNLTPTEKVLFDAVYAAHRSNDIIMLLNQRITWTFHYRTLDSISSWKNN